MSTQSDPCPLFTNVYYKECRIVVDRSMAGSDGKLYILHKQLIVDSIRIV